MNYTIIIPNTDRKVVTNKSNLASVIDSLLSAGHTIFQINSGDKVVSSGPKYKVGDQVRIIDNQNGHKFNIGEIVTIISIDYDEDDQWTQYDASNAMKSWFITRTECEPVNK